MQILVIKLEEQTLVLGGEINLPGNGLDGFRDHLITKWPDLQMRVIDEERNFLEDKINELLRETRDSGQSDSQP